MALTKRRKSTFNGLFYWIGLPWFRAQKLSSEPNFVLIFSIFWLCQLTSQFQAHSMVTPAPVCYILHFLDAIERILELSLLVSVDLLIVWSSALRLLLCPGDSLWGLACSLHQVVDLWGKLILFGAAGLENMQGMVSSMEINVSAFWVVKRWWFTLFAFANFCFL